MPKDKSRTLRTLDQQASDAPEIIGAGEASELDRAGIRVDLDLTL
jgi:hypothetical protein